MSTKKPTFVSGMTHQFDVVAEQVEVGLANIKHFFKFLEKLCECMPQDFTKAVKGMKPLEGDVMTQYAFVRTQTENLLLQYFNHERDLFLKMSEVVVKPLAKIHASNSRQKRALDLDLAKFNKALKDSKMVLQKDELESRVELEKYIKMHTAQLELRKNNKDTQPDSTSAYEKFLSGPELDTFKKQQLNANADAAAKSSPMYADYRRQKKKTFELFNRYELQLQQVRVHQAKFHDYVSSYLNELESMERYRLKVIEVYIRKLVSLFEFQSQRLKETFEGLDGMCQTVANLDEQQLQHSLKVWDFMYGPAPLFEILQYRLPCKANEIMEDYRTNFETCPPPQHKEPYVPPKGNPPPFIPDRASSRIMLGGAPQVDAKRNEAKSAFLAEHGQNAVLLEWPQAWDLASFLKSWRAVAVFKQFLEGEFSSENLIFWIKANRYRADLQAMAAEGEAYTLDRQLEKALAIYGEFVAPGSPRELNLPGPIRFEIKKGLDEAVSYKQKYEQLGPKAQQQKLEEDKPPDLTEQYQSAQECIFRLVEKDSFSRFMKTKIFEQFQQEAKEAKDNDDGQPAHVEVAAVEMERTCADCSKPLSADSNEKVCAACKLRQARVEKEVEDEIADITVEDLPPPISAPVGVAPVNTPTESAHLKRNEKSKSYEYNNMTLRPSDMSMFALKSDLEVLRKDVEALRMHVQNVLGAPITPRTPKASKEEFPCSGCGTIISPEESFCTECGLPRAKARGPPGPPK